MSDWSPEMWATHAQLDLRVIGGDEHRAFIGDEGFADLASHLRADRDVLQVRIGRGETPRRRHGLIERGVDAAVGADDLRQRVDVGSLQFVQLAMLQDELRHGESVLASSCSTSTLVE